MIENLIEFNNLLGGNSIQMKKRYFYFLNFGANKSIKKNSYKEVHIPKKNGDLRTLSVPSRRLKNLQHMVLTFLSYGKISSHAVAYNKGNSLLNNAGAHLNKKLLLKLDIKDFFGSISFGEVYGAIHKALDDCPDVGCNHNILAYYFTQFCTLEGSIPQGAPTSPLISNLIFFHMDEKIGEYCKNNHITYTRYSDDLIFSGQFHAVSLISFIEKLLAKNGYILNKNKTIIAGIGKQQKVTGILVNEKLQVPKSYRQKIRQEIYYIGKLGLNEHLQHIKGNDKDSAINNLSPTSYLKNLTGRVGFVLQIDPNNREFLGYKKDLINLLTCLPKLVFE